MQADALPARVVGHLLGWGADWGGQDRAGQRGKLPAISSPHTWRALLVLDMTGGDAWVATMMSNGDLTDLSETGGAQWR